MNEQLNQKTYYDILGVDKQATQEELNQARKQSLLALPPNSSSSDTPDYDRYVSIIEAFKVLSNPEKRRLYGTFESVVDANEIVDGLWLGDVTASLTKKFIHHIGITHILTILQQEHKLPVPNQLQIFCDDNDVSPLMDHFDTTFKFIDDALTNGCRVLVHCAAGVSRSPTVVTAFLMRKRNISFEVAFEIVKDKRPSVYPNNGFIEQLKKYQTQVICSV